MPLAVADRSYLLLAMIRFICAGYQTGEVKFWNAALCFAGDMLGPVNGPPLFARSVELVRAIRSEREHSFQFLPAPSGEVSQDETELMQLLETAAGHEISVLGTAAAQFTGRDAAHMLVRAALSLAALLQQLALCPCNADDRSQRSEIRQRMH